MIDKNVIVELAQVAGFGLLGCVAGFVTFAERISAVLALKYAFFSIICGPITYYILENTIDYNAYKHVGAIGAGYAGFFVFKGLSIILLRFSNYPVKTLESIVELIKGLRGKK